SVLRLGARIAVSVVGSCVMPPQPPSGTVPVPGARKANPIAAPPFETVKKRVLARLESRLDLSASKRMPASLLRQSLTQQAEQLTEVEGRGLSKPERDRLVSEALRELLGYGPLEELFADATVREVMVAGPAVVIVRRDNGAWMPTSVK